MREGLSVVSKGIDEDTAETDYTMEWGMSNHTDEGQPLVI